MADGCPRGGKILTQEVASDEKDTNFTVPLEGAVTLPRGVIGNTADFGSAIQGSSPCGVAILG
jgi:hypothetical protein